MKKLLYIMNAPSHYRWHLFETLHKIARTYSIDFRVAFLSPENAPHPWSIKDFPSNTFHFTVPWGINLRRNVVSMINPTFIASMLFQHWDWIIFGGYDNPTNLILLCLPLPLTKFKVIRNEGNPYVPSNPNPLLKSIKQFALSQCNAYLAPGELGKQWLNDLYPNAETRPIHTFPNVINNEQLVIDTKNNKMQCEIIEKYQIETQKRIFLSPARLSSEKGILEFLNSIPDDFAKGNQWLVAGVGSLEDTIQQQIKERNLDSGVKLLGYVHRNYMPALYGIADVFVLPSFRDPNPLSAIEAAFAGLPLLISRRIGNSPELLLDGQTGWGFDPANSEEMSQAIHAATTIPKEILEQLGAKAQARAYELFDSEQQVKKLLEFLLEIQQA